MIEPFYLLYRTGLAPTNGASVELSRMLRGVAPFAVHLMWDIAEGGSESVGCTVVADDCNAWRWPFYRGQGVYERFRKRWGLNWWDDGMLNAAKLRRRLHSFRIRPRRALVKCMTESDASHAIGLWEGLDRPPFVLHIVDILHDGLSEAETPNFVRLIQEANHVVCICDITAAEATKNGAVSTSLLDSSSEFTADDRTPLETPLRVVITGSLWKGVYEENLALEILRAAMPELRKRFVGIEFHYAGLCSDCIPGDLRHEIHDHGRLDAAAYRDLLRESHLAYLPISHLGHTVGRYSVPCRLADYLACGLPTIACTSPGTGTFSFLQSLPEGIALNVTDPDDLLEAVAHFSGTHQRWADASARAATYAAKALCVDTIRTRLFQCLDDYC